MINTVTLLFALIVTASGGLLDQFFDWKPSRGPRTDILHCPNACQHDPRNFPERCCSCNSTTDLDLAEINGQKVFRDLYIEYINMRGSGLAKSFGVKSSTTMADRIVHVGRSLRGIPRNICTFPNITYIDFHMNHIRKIGTTIQCLGLLDYLDLSFNRITFLTNDSFAHFPLLRKLNLSNNLISSIEPGTIGNPAINIFHMDISHNQLNTLDVQDVLLKERIFCKLDYKSSIKGEFTYSISSVIDPNDTSIYGSGDIDLSNGHFPIHPLSLITFYKSKFMSKHVEQFFPRGVITMDNVQLNCDCKIAALVQSVKEALRLFKSKMKGTMVPICISPDALRGVELTKLPESPALQDKLECHISKDCPFRCDCREQPIRDRLLVNCTNTDKRTLPVKLPDSLLPVHMLLGNNNIPTLINRDYLTRVSVLNVSGCHVKTFEHNVLNELKNLKSLDLFGHHITHLPKEIRLFHPDIINFGSKPLVCDCSNRWIGEWRRLGQTNASRALNCEVGGNIIPAEQLTENLLECETKSPASKILIPALVSLFVLSLLISLLLAFCHYEILILSRKLKTRLVSPMFENDVYVSFNENNEDVLRFVVYTLFPYLREHGYRVFIPYLHTELGTNIEYVRSEQISISKCCIFILTSDFGEEYSCGAEFNCAWFMFTKATVAHMLLINFDNCNLPRTYRQKMRALQRLGMGISVTDRHIELNKEVKMRLKSPLRDFENNDTLDF